MRMIVLSNRMRCLKQVAALALITAAMTGCSTDFARFDPALYTNSISAPPQNQNQSAINPYPGDVDPQTTASIQRSPVALPPQPGGPVGTYAQSQRIKPARPAAPQTHQTPSFARRAVQTYQQPVAQTYQKPVVPSYKPKPVTVFNAPVVKKQAVAIQQPARIDPVVTSSLKPAKFAAPVVKKPAPLPAQLPESKRSNAAVSTQQTSGWTSAGGTAILVREGETVYNISKRYGVPASELLRVNNIAKADHVKAGQQIIIPTYVYSSKAPVSAPDSNSTTRASRSSTGYLLEPKNKNIAIPTKKPGGYKPGLAPIKLTKRPQSASGNIYVVQSGDSLGMIAQRNNVTKNQIIAANSLDTTNIRIGQKLTIPNAATPKAGLAPMRTDGVVTGSTSNASPGPKPYSPPKITQKAPSRTGIDNFRWPVTGRVISKFGQTRRGNRNDGIDISVPEGTSVKAAENGLVIYSGTELQEFGRLLLVRHDDGWVSAYAHNKSLLVSDGQKVKRGQVIARSGRSGKAQVPMLHFELRKNSNPVNPQKHLR